ncbi:DUF2634 domain-containing protein [Clostridium kluyveri]|nr:DUF2634 domain-containing protein [Clostridium kluyveri]
MSILPQFDVNIDNVINQSIENSSSTVTTPKEYAWDFENDDFLLKDGKFVIVEGKEALKIWIWKALNTVKMNYSIYSDNYGHDLDSLIGQGFSSGLIESEARRIVWECISLNHHITGMQNFTTAYDGDTLTVSFTALTDQGEVDMDV